MSLLVAQECVQLGLRAGAIIFRNLHIVEHHKELRIEIANEVSLISARFQDRSALRSADHLLPFHEVLRKVGVNPRKEPPSVEKLIDFALRRGDLPNINSLVDAYNLVSVRTFCSLGAHDLDRIALPISLRILVGTESFTPLGRSARIPVIAGEYGYVDAQDRVLCRLDILQSDFSKVTTETRNIFLIVESTTAHGDLILAQAIEQVIQKVVHYCGGTAEVAALPTAIVPSASNLGKD